MSHLAKKLEASNKIIAGKLASDPKILEAKKVILDTVRKYQSQITAVRPADPELKKDYDDLLAEFAKLRGGQLWYPYLGSGIGNGALVELLDGSVKYDFISGIGVHFWGHSHSDIIESSLEAALSNTIMQGHLQQNADSLKFCELLIEASHLDHCFLTTSGAMANENALKLAFHKHYPADRVLAFEHSFAGRTIALTQITDKPAYREGLPQALSVDYLPFYDANRPEESTREAVKVLKGHLSRYPKRHAVMVFELVQGEGGFYPGSHEFFKALMTILKEHGVAIFIDEVQTFGRLSQLFAYQYFKLEEFVDLVSIGKLSQVCATLFRKEYAPKPGFLSQTFTGGTAVIRAATVIIEGLLKGGYYGPGGKIEKLHEYFVSKLKELEKKHPNLIRGPYGIGVMVAFTPLDGEMARVKQFSHNLFEAGVITFIAGQNPTRVRFLIPAGAVTTADIDTVVKIVESTLLKS